MIAKAIIWELVEKLIEGETFFLVDVSVTPSNKITILVDSPEGITINQCATISRKMEELLDRSKEDFDLMVSSPGLDSGFKVIQQYQKNIGRELEIIMKDQSVTRGILKQVGKNEIIIETPLKESGKGKLKEAPGIAEQKILLNNIKTAKVRIIF
jgi:ribosome maturation factor RimP